MGNEGSYDLYRHSNIAFGEFITGLLNEFITLLILIRSICILAKAQEIRSFSVPKAEDTAKITIGI